MHVLICINVMCCIYGNIYGIACVICIPVYINLAIKCSLHLFCIAPIYVDVIVLNCQ